MGFFDYEAFKNKTCETCSNSYSWDKQCEVCAKAARLKDVICPTCKSKNIEEGGIFEDNGVIGPGFHRWNTFPHLFCLDCGVIFKNLKGSKHE